MRPSDYSSLVDTVAKRFNAWTVRHLSFSGRLQLISSVIYSLTNFWMGAFLLPRGCLREIIRLCTRFLWSGDITKNGSVKVSWRACCLPKSEGGLGLRDLLTWNKVLQLKLIWILFTKMDSLWVSWVKHHWLRKHNFWTAPTTPGSSWSWRSLLSLRPLAQRMLSCKLGDGKTASFWFDRWRETEPPLIEVLGNDGPSRLGIPSTATVSRADVGGAWRSTPTRTRSPLITNLRSVLQDIPFPRQEAGPDAYLWGLDSDRAPHFSTRRTWEVFRPRNQQQTWSPIIWFKSGIPRTGFLLWVATLNRLPLKSRLALWGISSNTHCSICNGDIEDRNHLFLRCAYSKEIWTWIGIKLRCTSNLTNWDDLLAWLGTATSKPQKLLKLFAGHYAIYTIWKERNARVHTTTSRPATSLIQEIDKLVRVSLLANRSRRHHGKLLSLWFKYS